MSFVFSIIVKFIETRLTNDKVAAIKNVTFDFDKDVKFSLFGLRTDYTKKGGDIDLLILCKKADHATVIYLKFYFILKKQLKPILIVCKNIYLPIKTDNFMFSFGIFSTHLPYIVMAVFYAYVLIFGVEKASNGGVVSDTDIKIEIETKNYLTDSDSNSIYYFNDNQFTITTLSAKDLIVEVRLKHPVFGFVHSPLKSHCLSVFSRPPPL